MENSTNSNSKKILFTIAKCIAAFLLLLLCRSLVLKDNYILFFLSVILIATPLTIFSCARTMLHKEHAIKYYQPKSLAYKFASNRWFSFAFNFFICSLLSIILSVFIATLSKAEALACAVTLPWIAVMHMLILQLSKKVYKEKYIEYRSTFWKDFIVTIAGAFLYSFLVCRFGGVSPVHTEEFTVNRIAFVIDGIMEGINTVTYALLNNDLVLELSSPIYFAIAIFTLQGGILFFALSRFFLCCFLSLDRIESIFCPVKKTEKCEADKKKQIIQAVVFCISLVVSSSLIEFCLYKVLNYKNWAKIAVDKTTLIAEQVGNEVCRIGTSAKYALLGTDFTAETKVELEIAVNKYFEEMESNVDDYLDWYYSLGREYSELFLFLMGTVENQIEEKTTEFLNKNMEEKLSPDYNLEDKLEYVYNKNYEKFQKAKELLFKENRIENPNGLFQVQIKTTLPDIIQKAEKPEAFISGAQKFIVSAAGGTVAGVATTYVTKKVLTKLSTKMTQIAATKAVTKAATSAASKGFSKAISSALSGAIAGLAAGPAGTVIGTIIGVATTFGIDKLLLEIDELTNREAYRQDILSCIEEEKQFYINLVRSL